MNIVFIKKDTKELEIINIDESKDIAFKKDRMIVYSGNSAHYCDMIYDDYLFKEIFFIPHKYEYPSPFEKRILNEIKNHFNVFSNKKEDIRKELGILGEV